MGQFESGRWIVLLLLYFVFFFLIVYGVVNAQAAMGTSERRTTLNDPGFQDRIQTFYDPRIQGKCEGKGFGRAMGLGGNIACWNLDIDENDYLSCNNISGCIWQNATLLFNISVFSASCGEYVNNSFYSISPNATPGTYCTSPGLAQEDLCKTFKCDWINQSELAQQAIALNTKNPITIWQTIGFVAGFRADIGLLGYTWIFSFLFFWIPFVMLIWSIYMSLPIIH